MEPCSRCSRHVIGLVTECLYLSTACRWVIGGAARTNKGRSLVPDPCDGLSTATRQIAGAEDMNHPHLAHETFTNAAIEDFPARRRMTEISGQFRRSRQDHPHRPIPVRLAIQTTNPSQTTCGGTV